MENPSLDSDTLADIYDDGSGHLYTSIKEKGGFTVSHKTEKADLGLLWGISVVYRCLTSGRDVSPLILKPVKYL